MTDTPATDAVSSKIQSQLNSCELDDWHAAYEAMHDHAQALERTLTSIANATSAKWEVSNSEFKDEFRSWAQNRARHATQTHNADD